MRFAEGLFDILQSRNEDDRDHAGSSTHCCSLESTISNDLMHHSRTTGRRRRYYLLIPPLITSYSNPTASGIPGKGIWLCSRIFWHFLLQVSLMHLRAAVLVCVGKGNEERQSVPGRVLHRTADRRRKKRIRKAGGSAKS
jgi:hypothetical protein